METKPFIDNHYYTVTFTYCYILHLSWYYFNQPVLALRYSYTNTSQMVLWPCRPPSQWYAVCVLITLQPTTHTNPAALQLCHNSPSSLTTTAFLPVTTAGLSWWFTYSVAGLVLLGETRASEYRLYSLTESQCSWLNPLVPHLIPLPLSYSKKALYHWCLMPNLALLSCVRCIYSGKGVFLSHYTDSSPLHSCPLSTL